MKTLTMRVAIAASSLIAVGAVFAGATSAQAATHTVKATHVATCKGVAASLSADQCAAFKAENKALLAERASIYASYGITVPSKGKLDRVAVRQSVSALTNAQRKALHTQMQAWRAQHAALFAKYGLTAQG